MKYIILSFSSLLIFLSPEFALADEIRIATGYTFIKRVFDPIRIPFRNKTGVELKINFKDPLPAMAELESGTVEVAGASLTVENWLELANKEGIKVKGKNTYKSVVVVTEKSHFVVNGANKITSLSYGQLKGIFTGKITNWMEVGGANTPILVVWPSISSGALIIVKQKIMDSEPLTKSIYDVETVGDTADAVAATPEAIGVVTGIDVEKGLREIAQPIERPLTLIYKGKASVKLQKLLDYLNGEGKQLIK